MSDIACSPCYGGLTQSRSAMPYDLFSGEACVSGASHTENKGPDPEDGLGITTVD